MKNDKDNIKDEKLSDFYALRSLWLLLPRNGNVAHRK